MSFTYEDFEILDFDIFKRQTNFDFFGEKYKEEFQIVKEKKTNKSYLMKIVCFYEKKNTKNVY